MAAQKTVQGCMAIDSLSWVRKPFDHGLIELLIITLYSAEKVGLLVTYPKLNEAF